MKSRKEAFTLIEISIGIIISALLLTGILNLFSSGMKGSTKGMAYQANMETATILMAQIEYDLLKAVHINYPVSAKDPSEKQNMAQWQFYKAPEGIATVTYQIIDNNVVRPRRRSICWKGSPSQPRRSSRWSREAAGCRRARSRRRA